ncbi:hypothetical protein BZA70DRAFT_289909 [Myxozyma melibiosi]|uniref:V-type proton ATPase subunit C n=1 Tax=Myxozyma melibiosi TaxID=54550 RepID=A0ABR1F451_9ASCO
MAFSAPTGPLYYIVSLPSSVAPAGGDAESSLVKDLSSTLNLPSKDDVSPFLIPHFKIGTLDQLVQQSEELAKADSQFEAVVGRAVDVLKGVYDSKDEVAAAKVVADKQPETYLKSFQWNTAKYRVDKPLAELVDTLSKEIFALDADLKAVYSNYMIAKSNLAAVDRKQTGALSTRSLQDVVKKEHFVLGSEYLETVLVAVPKSMSKTFVKVYETLVPMVVPRSATIIAEDDEFVLYNPTLFRKSLPEFIHKCRENKWFPREFKWTDGIIEDLKKEKDRAIEQERRVWGEVVRLARATYSDAFMAWVHLKSIRVFVESVLRYGLPPDFISVLVKPPVASITKAKTALTQKYGYLAGNAFSKDKKGKVVQEDAGLQEYASIVDTEYEAFVIYDIVVV